MLDTLLLRLSLHFTTLHLKIGVQLQYNNFIPVSQRTQIMSITYISSDNVRHPVTKTFTTLHYTSLEDRRSATVQ